MTRCPVPPRSAVRAHVLDCLPLSCFTLLHASCTDGLLLFILTSDACCLGGATAEGKPIPTELRNEEADLRRQVELEDDNTGAPPSGHGRRCSARGTDRATTCAVHARARAPTVHLLPRALLRRPLASLCLLASPPPAAAVPRTHIDDEYAHAGERDPKILITTSRDPSSRLVQFAKEVKLLLPNSQRVNRGGMVRTSRPAERHAERRGQQRASRAAPCLCTREHSRVSAAAADDGRAWPPPCVARRWCRSWWRAAARTTTPTW